MRALFVLDSFQVEPLGVGYLAAAVERAGFEVDWLKSDDKRLIDKISDYSPSVLAYSTTTGKHRKFVSLNRKIKASYPAAVSVFGGSHPTYFPEMVSDPGVDYIVRGEAEHSFVEFLRELGWGYRIRSVVDFAPLCQNLDELPFPDREFLYKYPENRDNPIKNVLTSRGCLFSCPYCFNSLYRSFYRGQQWVRYRSPENVVAECRDLMRYPTKMIYFQDDELLTNPKFFDLMRLYETKVRIPFHCQIRIELLTRPIAFWLKLAGCAGVTFAIESGNDYIRGNVLQRRMSREAIMRGVDLLRQFGIKFRIENMVGLPGEGIDEMLETLDLNIECAPDYGWASIFQPYPKLPLAEYAKNLGAWDGQIDEFSESFFEHTVLKNGRKEIANMQRLFGIAVSFPAVRTFIRTLLRLPNNAIYDKVSKIWKRNRFRRLYSEAYS